MESLIDNQRKLVAGSGTWVMNAEVPKCMFYCEGVQKTENTNDFPLTWFFQSCEDGESTGMFWVGKPHDTVVVSLIHTEYGTKLIWFFKTQGDELDQMLAFTFFRTRYSLPINPYFRLFFETWGMRP